MKRRKPKDILYAQATPNKSRKEIEKQWMRKFGKRREGKRDIDE